MATKSFTFINSSSLFTYRWSDASQVDYEPWADGFPATDNNGHYCVSQPSKNDGTRSIL